MGFGLRCDMAPTLGEEACFWAGYGGSLILIDMANRTTMAYAMNRMSAATAGDMRAGILAAYTIQGLMS